MLVHTPDFLLLVNPKGGNLEKKMRINKENIAKVCFYSQCSCLHIQGKSCLHKSGKVCLEVSRWLKKEKNCSLPVTGSEDIILTILSGKSKVLLVLITQGNGQMSHSGGPDEKLQNRLLLNGLFTTLKRNLYNGN